MKALFSYVTTFLLLGLMALGAAVATFLENDFGTQKARLWVYDHIWFESVIFLALTQMLCVMIKVKMYKKFFVFTFHLAFIVIFMGAALTRFWGYETQIELRPHEKASTVFYEGVAKKLPFEIELRRFILKRYPGTSSPESYQSEVTIHSLTQQPIQATIALNAPLDIKGYRLFQASYSNDEKNTVLSINKDPGKSVTYIGYALLFMGLLFNLFEPKSRFRTLLRKSNGAVFTLLIIGSTPLLFGSTSQHTEGISTYVQNYLNDHRVQSQALSESFGEVMVQSRMGRIKPLDTLNREVLRKISGSTTVFDMNANQVILGLYSRPKLWRNLPIVSLKSKPLKKFLKLPKESRTFSFHDFFDKNGTYLLEDLVTESHQTKAFKRTQLQKAALKLDEKISVFFMGDKGSLLKIFPIPNKEALDSREEDNYNHPQRDQWLSIKDFWSSKAHHQDKEIQKATQTFLDNVFARDYSGAMPSLQIIKDYQSKHGGHLFPHPHRIRTEILYNALNPFPKLMIIDLILGLALITMGFIGIFSKKASIQIHKNISRLTLLTLFVIHALPLAMRSYVSGHAPWSDTYESLLAIAVSSILANLMLQQRALFPLGASIFMAGIFLFVAHLGNIDPEITNLVPVLKSFWLSVHVSVIIASYGFFGITSIIAVITLLLIAYQGRHNLYRSQIQQLDAIHEAHLILGITLLIIGNFLGGIWANESWGRYWGWDPKETWTFISIIAYTLVIHLRFLKRICNSTLFSSASLAAYGCILMTYFGVNFYLSGKHSYATGDPVLIPQWVYILASTMVILCTTAHLRGRKRKPQIVDS
jgi:cytochrome c-type biogenesis protein CcsB